MTDRRDQSFQQLDPVGGFSARPVTLLLAVVVVAYVVATTLIDLSTIRDLPLALFAVVAIGMCSLGLVIWSSPLRAPFPSAGFAVIVLLALAAMILIAYAGWHEAILVPDWWGPVAVGLILVALAPYRPPREILAVTLLGVLTVAVLVFVASSVRVKDAPPLAILVETALPLVAMGLASAAYASSLGRTVDSLRSSAEEATRAATDSLRGDIARSVQQDRVSILDESVVPFLTELLRTREVTEETRDRAAEIAAAIRAVMVADVDRTWLDTVIDHGARMIVHPSPLGSEVLADDHRLAPAMSTQQRTVVRAYLVALLAHPGFDPDGFSVTLTRAGDRAALVLRAKLDLDESVQRSSLAAYYAVLRIVFPDLTVSFSPPHLTLRFSYAL
ncbi:hypothetical protein [Galbitalea soli]|uniref:Uncharacterized protein n=1 Tax=Galbitalea soli TaxID=1268042 RepID=A0A7C9TRN4_9MICO|nr:hypothetical protein [Galbitalea soli]NEM92178.1 hypothetical protein [Galbitalea soli]NYJ31868.1 hypothetical protein [Galbitalea soli]